MQALRIRLSVAKHGPPTVLARLFMRAGFQPIESPASGIGCFMSFIEGTWVWLLTWTYNPRGLIHWRFNRTHCEFWIPARHFLRAMLPTETAAIELCLLATQTWRPRRKPPCLAGTSTTLRPSQLFAFQCSGSDFASCNFAGQFGPGSNWSAEREQAGRQQKAAPRDGAARKRSVWFGGLGGSTRRVV